jgi:hypothetical protein
LEKISSGKLKGVYASTAALQEIVFWFYKRQLFDDLVKVVNFLTHLQNVEWIAVTPEICQNASLLISERGVSSFDAYHVWRQLYLGIKKYSAQTMRMTKSKRREDRSASPRGQLVAGSLFSN